MLYPLSYEGGAVWQLTALVARDPRWSNSATGFRGAECDEVIVAVFGSRAWIGLAYPASHPTWACLCRRDSAVHPRHRLSPSVVRRYRPGRGSAQ